jgi:hypothetical protein
MLAIWFLAKTLLVGKAYFNALFIPKVRWE